MKATPAFNLLPVPRSRRRKLLLWAARNCAVESSREHVDPDLSAELNSWATAYDLTLRGNPTLPKV